VQIVRTGGERQIERQRSSASSGERLCPGVVNGVTAGSARNAATALASGVAS
jgi:hypothetical protein